MEKQVVPPDFHLASSSSSLFGEVDSGDSDESNHEERKEINGTKGQRGKWKSLRDFVDFGSVVKAIEDMDEDRDTLEVSTFELRMKNLDII